jgi:hypothetical protein
MLTRYYEPKKENRYKWTFIGENASGKMIIPEMTVMMGGSSIEVPPSSTNSLLMKFRRIDRTVCQEILDRMKLVRMGSINLWSLVPDEKSNLVEKWDLDGVSVPVTRLQEDTVPLQTIYTGIVNITYFDAYRGS